MKSYVDELFEIHKEKTFEQFLVDELIHQLALVEQNWVTLMDVEDTEWIEYRLLLENISHHLNTTIDFIERTQGPEIVSILYGEVYNLVEEKILTEDYIDSEVYAQIQYILAALGSCINPEILELGVIEDGALKDHLTNEILAALEKFGEEEAFDEDS